MNKKIGVLDSGIGGTTTLREIRKLLPCENFLYFGDSKNCPYGEKSDEELLALSRKNVKRLLKENVKLIVVACNTLTTRVLKMLRGEFKEIDFIGTEPALKPALESPYKNILILSTPATARFLEPNLSTVLKENPEKTVLNLPCPGLASAIESRDNALVEKTLENLLSPLRKDFCKKVELVVLGCTHYPIILEKFKLFFPNAIFLDGNAGVARRVKEILEQKNLLTFSASEGTVEYIFT